MSNDHRALRDALGCFATGVTVVTTQNGDGEPIGVTVNAFSSVSLDPPLLLFCLDRQAFSLESFRAAKHFCVNVLSEGQQELSVQFAVAGRQKWSNVPYRLGESACPLIEGALATFECGVEQVVDGGDHVVFFGRILRAMSLREGRPLLFYRGRYEAVDDGA
jgi:flavin reductase (DIM6/NTAB) family NADH-FMN oxidoreductase RutF